ncbi:hypothetical protein EVAR_98238_1 [Eumeta japonica]|uniref:Uncharacterized protein n=1 Tax=Eumeta variegata TaxID=151549 RepID=A0A4C1Y3Q3_EUMVA|nr:hypothetical protein EVAR_98238_1 [Eumeta japonica]
MCEKDHGQNASKLHRLAKPRLIRNKLMLCVWWNWKGIIRYEQIRLQAKPSSPISTAGETQTRSREKASSGGLLPPSSRFLIPLEEPTKVLVTPLELQMPISSGGTYPLVAPKLVLPLENAIKSSGIPGVPTEVTT